MADPNRPEKPAIRALRTIRQDKYSSDFVKNMQELNSSTEFMAKMLIVMQGGIDDANASIIEQIQGAIDELIIIFTGEGIGDLFDFGALEDLFGGNGILGIIATAIGNFIQALINLLPFGIGEGLTGLADSLASVDTKADTAIDTVTVISQQVTAFDVKTNRPIGETITPLGYGPYAHSQLTMLTATQTGTTNAPDSGVHSHTMPATRDPEKSFTNVTVVTFIRVTSDDAIKLMYFYAKGTPTSLVARFYRMSADGNLSELLGTSSNIASSILSSWTTQLITFPEEALVQTGDILGMCLSVSGTVMLAGIEKFDPAPIPGFNPAKNGAVLATTSPGSTVSVGSLDFTSGWITYMEASRSIGQEAVKRAIADNFDRANGALGPSWSLQETGSGMRIVGLAAAWSGTTDGYSNALYTTPLTTSKTRGRMIIGSVNSSATGRYAGAIVRCNAARSSWGGVFFDADEICIVKGTGANSFTVLHTFAITPVATDILDWNLTDAHWELLLNGAVLFDEDISTIAHGVSNRYEGVYASRNSFQSSGSIASWLANDIQDEEVP